MPLVSALVSSGRSLPLFELTNLSFQQFTVNNWSVEISDDQPLGSSAKSATTAFGF